jgi:hypothetical protein
VIAARPELLARLPTAFSLQIGLSAPEVPAIATQMFVSLAAIAAVWILWRRAGDIVTRSRAWAAGSLLVTLFIYSSTITIWRFSWRRSRRWPGKTGAIAWPDSMPRS